ncbi:jmjC domain-containing protein 7 [Carex littledalei]|uniref:JmjC domain-containing protein 7 n=1 Tax=Carex littledalei TaxID=544730 RepID=A0A833RJ98_9POAL|nr:jmjC domain-containing protein 7 [Carex littledalei]
MEEESVRGLWTEARELIDSVSADSGGVERLESPPSPLQFIRDYVSPNKPVIISSAATRHWPAISRSLWSDDAYLRRALSGCSVSVHLTPDGRADALVPSPSKSGLCFASAFVQSMDFSEAMQLIEATGEESSPVVAYAQQQDDCLRGEYEALAGDVDAHIPWATEALGCLPEAVNLWIGNARSHTSYHKDHYENIYAVITGEKHFLLLPPTEVHRLYVRNYPAAHYISSSKDNGGEVKLELELEEPEKMVPWCSVDPYPASDEIIAEQSSSFPLYYNGPKPFQCTVRAGEILYLPSMWFHHVTQSPDDNGRTIAVNYWYDMQFDMKYAYYSFLQSINLYRLSSVASTQGEDKNDIKQNCSNSNPD